MSRTLWDAAGGVALALAIAGIALPLVPTTPFLLLAAFCWYRGSPERYTWLINHPRYGAIIRDWQEHRAIARRTKVVAIAAMGAMVVATILMNAPRAVLAVQVVILVIVGVIIITRPERPSG